MLRVVIWSLLLANAVYFAWAHGHLAPLGFAPQAQTEPERMQTQLRPEVLRLLNAPKAGGASASAAPAPNQPAPNTSPADTVSLANGAGSAPPDASNATPLEPDNSVDIAATDPNLRCWQATGFTTSQADTLRSALQQLGLRESAWQLNEARLGGRWIVYMGRLSDEQMDKKKTELRELKIDFREVTNASLRPGLALGTFSNKEAAEQGLQQMLKKGVRTARTEQERDDNAATFALRLPAATDQEKAAVAAMGAPLYRKALKRCE